jgi:hypothetical protein
LNKFIAIESTGERPRAIKDMQIFENMDTKRLSELRHLSTGLNDLHIKIQVKETILCALQAVVITAFEQAALRKPELRDATHMLKETGEKGAALLLTLAASVISGSSKLVDIASATLAMVLDAHGTDFLQDCDIEPLLDAGERFDLFIADMARRIEKVTIILEIVDTEIQHLQNTLAHIKHGR